MQTSKATVILLIALYQLAERLTNEGLETESETIFYKSITRAFSTWLSSSPVDQRICQYVLEEYLEWVLRLEGEGIMGNSLQKEVVIEKILKENWRKNE